MRALIYAMAGTLALSACVGSVHHEAHGPAGIPYLCGNAPARITYEGGGYYPRGSADLQYEGRNIHLAATPPTYGLRYQEPRDERPVLVWSARGEEAWLSELGADFSERELAHCTRVREGAAAEVEGVTDPRSH